MRLVCQLTILHTLYYITPSSNQRKNIDLIERIFQRAWSLYLACNDKNAFFSSEEHKRYILSSCQKVREALTILLDNIYVRFGTMLYRHTVGIPMGINCPPFVADIFLFCYKRDFAPVFQWVVRHPGISRCRSQHVSDESSSLFHHSIYLWFICFPWWSIDELENFHVNRTTKCMFWAMIEAEGEVGYP